MKSVIYEELAQRLQDAGLADDGCAGLVDPVDLIDAAYTIRAPQSRLEALDKEKQQIENEFINAGRLLVSLEKENASLKQDASRIDWLESCNESHGFCHTGWGEYRYYSYVEDGYPSVRQVLDAAMQANKGE